LIKITSIEEYIELHPKWSALLRELRKVLLTTELEENIKWNSPVYSLNGKNIVGLGAFKNHAGLWFFQGVFLDDSQNKLVNAQEGKTKGLRQWRFESNVIDNITLVKSYVLEAIENQKLGKEIKVERNKELVLPAMLADLLKENSSFKNSFEKLSLSKQREYAEYICEAKRETTKVARLEKITPMIEVGKGLHDKYKNC